MIYGYIRVSTSKQYNGNGMEVQREEILSKYNNVEIIEEVFTGATTKRPQLENLIKVMTSGDTLVVTKLDRLARNTVEGITIIQQLFNSNISVHVLNIGLLENTTMGKFFLTTLLAVAEMERNIIIERTQAGKEVAKLNPNFKEGRPKKFNKGQYMLAIELKENGKTYKEIESMTGLSKSTVFRAHRDWKASNM